MLITGEALPFVPWDFQETATQRTREKLRDMLTALVVMPTGAGKTLTMGYTIAEEMLGTAFPKVLVLQATKKLLRQNREKISMATAHICATTTVVQGSKDDWSGDIVFGSIPTIQRARRLKRMPVVTHVVVDEAHRSGAAGCKRIIAWARKLLPHVKVLLYTATPNRADGEPIASVEELAYQITYAELIDRRIIVPVSTRTIDLGLRTDLEKIRMSGGEYDMATLGALLNKQIHHDAVIQHWRDQGASDRPTVGFCPTVAHAVALCAAFRAAGVNAAVIHDGLDDDRIEEILDEYEAGRHQVILNCMMLIEGWDSPRTSCIINLRAMAAELTFIQAVGRGMRAFPGKEDCLLLDFAGAALRHGTIEIRVMREREARMRAETHVHVANDNHVEQSPKEIIREFAMREIDLMRRSKPRFVEIEGRLAQMIAVQRDSWAAVMHSDGMWYSATRLREGDVHVSACTTANEAMTMGDRFLAADHSPSRRDFENLEPTYEQRRQLTRMLISDPEATRSRYNADCFIAANLAQVAVRRAMRALAVPKAA